MSKLADVIWLNTSPSLGCFSQPLLQYLSQTVTVQEWKYCWNKYKAGCLDTAVLALHDHLKSHDKKLHLIGHGTAGLLGLLYTCRYPNTVKSLTLLAVGADSAVNWQAHYYDHRPFKTRSSILNAMVYNLFGYHDERTVKKLEGILEQDLDYTLSPHSLFKKVSLRPTSVAVPFMVCGSFDDIIAPPDALRAWQPYFKESDRLSLCPGGKHFFHFFHPEFVARQMLDFWNCGDLQQKSKVARKSGLLT